MSIACFDHNLMPVDLSQNWHNQRSFLYGDGHFTTIKVQNGRPLFLHSHIERLKLANTRLRFGDVAWLELKVQIEKCVFALESGFARVHISRGAGGRGYGGTQQLEPFIFISKGDWIEPTSSEMLSLRFLDTRLSQNKLLAGLKHNNRIEQVLIAQELEEKSLLDGLVVDVEGNLIETNKANVFWFDGTHWFTPELNLAGVAGVMRAEILKRNPKVIEGVFPVEMVLEQCESMLICNSLILVKPVHYLQNNLHNKKLDVQHLNRLDLSFL